MQWVIDRIENGFAIIECDDLHIEIPIKALPKTIEEGSLLDISVTSGNQDLEQAKALLRELEARDNDEDSIDL